MDLKEFSTKNILEDQILIIEENDYDIAAFIAEMERIETEIRHTRQECI